MNVKFDSKEIQSHVISHEGSKWLSPHEYSLIRREVELTIILLEQIPDGEKGIFLPRFCSRGLEDFRYAETISTLPGPRRFSTCLKPEVLHRRKLVIRAVLDEQESQRKRIKQRGKARSIMFAVHQERYDHGALRRACLIRANIENSKNAIDRGLKDAQQARVVFLEDKSPRQTIGMKKR